MQNSNHNALNFTSLFTGSLSAADWDLLSWTVKTAALGIWVFDIPRNQISCNKEYLDMTFTSSGDAVRSAEEWKALWHPEDLPQLMRLLEDCLAGRLAEYECEIRIRHYDGNYLWTRCSGRIIAYDNAGTPVKLVGVLMDIDELVRSRTKLTETLKSLEHNSNSLESAVEKHTIEMEEQGRLLWTVNQISRKLLAVQPSETFESLVHDCLRLLGESLGKNRVYIWKDFTNAAGLLCCTQIYEWARGVASIQGRLQFGEIPYDNMPTFQKALHEGKCLNRLLKDFTNSEKNILSPQGIKTLLISPMSINGKQWGFIGVDNCENEQLFTDAEENLLLMCGAILASAIEKKKTDAALREMEERTQIMLNATPLCCNLWTAEFCNMSCNDEAVRLFELSSQEEYLERFYELSPEHQPGGRLSNELAAECISKAFQDGYYRFEWLHQKLDGTPIPAEITLVRIKYKDSFIVAGYTRDLREEKAMLAELQTKEALRRARDEALLNSKAKSNFLANMSHEIRTPMNAISGFAEIILRESAGEKITEYAKGIKGACSSLINIINDILDISKIESGKLEIFNSSYEFAALLNEVITISRMRLGDSPLMFITDIDSHLPARLVGDEVRIRQILLNILSNAIKFTKTGYISLRVSGTVEGNKALLQFSVKDSGVGIKPGDLNLLFEEFERVNTTRNRSIEGTGLGLAISRKLCEMMGGNIRVESTYGRGSEFTALIPQECPSSERLAQVTEKKHILLYEPRERYRFSIAKTLENLDCGYVACANQSELYNHINVRPYDYILTAALYLSKVQTTILKNNLQTTVAVFSDYGETISDDDVCILQFPINCLQLSALLNGLTQDTSFSRHNTAATHFSAPSAHVLVVDDSPVNLQVAKGLMEPYQFSIDTAQNGTEAVSMISNTKYDLVFMDHMMPEMDGVDATIAIRKLEGSYYQNLPIIALTANALVGTREMFIREGMNDFLAKPIELNKLAHLLFKWLPKSKIVKSVSPESVKADSPDQSWDIMGVDIAHGILSVGGSRENYLKILLAYYTDGMQKCSLLQQYLVNNDLSAFRTEVHALKSTSATIGALEVSIMAEKLEAAAQNKDLAFISENIEGFLDSFQTVLKAIHLILPDDLPASSQTAPADSRGGGSAADLKNSLECLYDAAELANISLIEEELSRLLAFTWADGIMQELQAMQKYLSVFDYDGILECIIRIKKSLNL